MKTRRILITLALAGLLMFSAQGEAVGGSPGTLLGFTVGGVLPYGEFSDIAGEGWVAGVNMQSMQVGSVVFGGEILYNYFSTQNPNSDAPRYTWTSLETQLTSFQITGHFKWFPLKTKIEPYLRPGFGLYATKVAGEGQGFDNDNGFPVTFSDRKRSTDFGINAGLGIQFPLGSSMVLDVNAIWHLVFTSITIEGVVDSQQSNWFALGVTLLFRT